MSTSTVTDTVHAYAAVPAPGESTLTFPALDCRIQTSTLTCLVGPHRSQIGYLSGVSPLLSVQHGLMNVMLPMLYHRKLSFREAADKARKLIAELNCDFEPTTFPAMLNSFQRSQLALARALILEPTLLFLDVPFHDLGAKQREEMGLLLGKYKQQRSVC